MSTVTRVIKNTIFLYVKMGVTIVVSLYSTRLVLQALGASDFGLFTLVGGAIGMMGFLNSTMANATQRYMSYAEGEGIITNKLKVFNISILLHILIALITLVLFIGAYFPLFDTVFNIEPNRINAAKVLYFSFVISTCFTITTVPYEAVLNAHENMLYYSLVGIIESFFKLAIAFACMKFGGDKLILYGALMACIPIFSWTVMRIYCRSHYNECTVDSKYWDLNLIKEIASFSGWNFLTAITYLLSGQGISIVLNYFFGTKINAAYGISQQVNSQLSAFAENMKKALNPVIVKSAGSNNDESMNHAALMGCKYSSLLTVFFGVPLVIEMPYVLKLWLNIYPDWTVDFCRLQLFFLLVTQLTSSLATSIYAKGNIKNYTICKSITNLAPIGVAYLCFRFGMDPIALFIPYILIWGLGGNFIIIYYAKRNCRVVVKDYIRVVLVPILFITILMIVSGSIICFSILPSFGRLLVTCLTTTVVMVIGLWLFGLNRTEKSLIKGFLQKLFHI